MSKYESNLSIYTPTFAPSVGLRRFGSTVGIRAAGLLTTLLEWRERARSRRHLAGLNDYMLRDIGVDQAAAAAEADRAFWRR